MTHATRKLTGKLPWTRSCFVCGESNPHGLHSRSRIEDGRVMLDYTTRESDRGYRHIMHGGIAVTLLDEVMTWAAISATGRVCVAAELGARLKQPIRVPEQLRVVGWTTRVTSRLIMTEGRIIGPDGAERLTATGKYVPMPEDQLELTEKDFVLSGDTIPPKEIMGGH